MNIGIEDLLFSGVVVQTINAVISRYYLIFIFHAFIFIFGKRHGEKDIYCNVCRTCSTTIVPL